MHVLLKNSNNIHFVYVFGHIYQPATLYDFAALDVISAKDIIIWLQWVSE